MNKKVLLVDDELDVANSLIEAIKRRNNSIEILHASNREQAKKNFLKENPPVTILDLTLDINEGPQSGLNLLSELIELNPSCRFIILTGHQRAEKGIEALNRGALTYFEKPANPDILLALINDGIEIVNFKRNSSKIEISNSAISNTIGTSAKSVKMKKALEQINFAIQTNQPILITGDTGTGKGVLARLIHKNSPRKNHPFIRYQPTYSNTDLIMSELFGHKKGAFTGASEERKGLIEEANHGTLFIDEVDSLPKETQVLLLETLQEKTFRKIGASKETQSDFRLISALNRDINEVLKSNAIRQDFYHRIAHFKIDLPPLKERVDDFEILIENILAQFCDKEGLDIAFVDDSSLYKLKHYSWPGNIRELQATIEGAAYRASINQRKFITSEDIVFQNLEKADFTHQHLSFRERIRSHEEQIICKALKDARGNQVKAAKDLDMDRTVFRRILSRIEKDTN